ncbi:hypothetical protein CWS01_15200 [Niallia nealsonii]|uniref:Uncharacterized protein n=1 Tax=Niallia nealsonii TaxID=115979 RepID=A0A2N0YZZ4_9BACI|nr:hypothetical protein CWS01_15200 [Niallia nealsonii]
MGLSALVIGNNITNAEEQLDLFTINDYLKKEKNITINEWSLYAREKLENAQTYADTREYQTALNKKFPELKWQESKSEQSKGLHAIISSNETVEKTITISTSLTTKPSQTYVIYEVKGKDLTEIRKKEIKKEMQANISAIFQEKPTIFSCIKGEFNDKINEALPYYVNHFLKLFQAKQIEALEEDEFISASAYSPVFKEEINNGNQAINVQVGIRKQGMGGKTTFIVGTPIITIEY